MNNVIADRFTGCSDPEQIRQRVTVRPDPVAPLNDLDHLVASEIFADALKKIFIPNKFSIEFIKETVDRAQLHHNEIFSSYVAYVSKIYTPPESEVFPICLTGLAGVGKTQTIAALRKVLPAPINFSCDHYDGEVTLSSHWYKSARGNKSGKALLAEFLSPENPGSIKGTLAKALQECRRRAVRDGVSLLILDETQHINTGLASAKITEILLTMAAIGPPMIYICNYSLAHKLLGRNSEDKQRLLSEPRVMLPDDPQSSDWKDYISECIRVSNGHVKADATEFADEVYRCTFGVKRLVVQLLKQAYIESRKDRRHHVELSDLSRAFRSTPYTSSAGEVEELGRQAMKNGRATSRVDLRCPFELPPALKTNVVQFTNHERQKRVEAKVFDSSLTEVERAGLKQLSADAAISPEKVKKTRKPAAIQLSDDEKAKAFSSYLDAVVSPPKPKRPT